MKNLFSKVLVGVAGFAMAIGMSAFAATTPAITDLKVEVKDKAKGTVTVSGTVAGDADSKEATIIVLPESVKTLAENFSNDDIKYIDQETAQTGGAFSFDFTLVSGVKYNVWCGGTEVAAEALGQDVIDLTSEASGYKIVGTIVLPAGKVEGATAQAGVIGADNTFTSSVDGTVTVKTENTADYSIAVGTGTYAVSVGKPGWLYKVYENVDATAKDVNLGEINLIPGQFTEDSHVNLSDLTLFLSHYGEKKAELGDEFDDKFDLNGSGDITVTDLTLLLSGYGRSYSAE